EAAVRAAAALREILARSDQDGRELLGRAARGEKLHAGVETGRVGRAAQILGIERLHFGDAELGAVLQVKRHLRSGLVAKVELAGEKAQTTRVGLPVQQVAIGLGNEALVCR